MRIYHRFISSMVQHLKSNQFYNLPMEESWSQKVEFDLVHQQIRFVAKEGTNELASSYYQLGNRLFHLHEASLGFPNPAHHPLNIVGRWPSQWFKRIKRVQKIRDRIFQEGIQSDFDEMFLQNYTYFNQLAQDALFYLEDLDYPEATQESLTYGVLAYKNLSWDDIEFQDGELRFVNHENWVMDIPVRDIAQFIKNESFKSSKLDDSIEFLHGYQQQRELLPSEYHLIYAMLLYPSKFLRFVEEYDLSRNDKKHSAKEEFAQLIKQYEDWEEILGEFPQQINKEFDVQISTVNWLRCS